MEQIKRRALGMGLEELFNNEQLDLDKFEEKIITDTPKNEIVNIKLSELRSNPYQPRTVFDEEKLKELSESIKEHGVFQPIIVKKSIKGYEIVAGERRYKASLMANLDTIPAIVRDFTDEEMMEIAILENLQRENLNAIEEATAYSKLIEKLNITQDELATKLGKSRSYVTNMIGLLSLPKEEKNMLVDGKISTSHGRTLSKLKNKEEIIEIANKIVSQSINVRDLETLSKEKEIEKKHRIVKRQQNNQYSYLENSLSEKLGTKVKFKPKKMEIYFENNHDLERIIEILNLDKEISE